MPGTVGNARYFPWDGGSIFAGKSGEFPAHAHQAIQICFLFDGFIQLRADDDSPWADYGLAVVPSRRPHGMNGSGVHYGAVIFVEPETREGRILTETYAGDGIASADRGLITAVLPQLRSAVLERRGSLEIVTAARRLVQALTRDTEPSVISDERILRAVAYINSNLAHTMRGASLSTAAHAAGFADSAHLSRTCRRMMGIPPSLFDVSGPGASGD